MPLLWWAIALVMFVHDVIGNLETSARPDASSVLQAGSRWLHDPSAIYLDTARFLAQTGMVPVTGLIRPPAAAMLAAPFTLLPPGWQVAAWTAADAAAVVLGLWLLQRELTRTSLERAMFWAVALYCPPLYADVAAGQIGGFVFLPACAAMIVFRRRPGWSGVLTAAAAGLKLYPALMVVGARRRWRPFIAAAAGAGVLVTAVASLPLGPRGALAYVTGVLIPSLRAPNPDCAQTSVATLFGRSIGGEPYPIINGAGGITILQSPVHLPALASVLTVLVLTAVIVGAFAAARASGWNAVYGMALGLALGALLPGELNPYQYLPLLPLILIVMTSAVRRRNRLLLGFIAAGLLLWLRQPCLLPFPNVWTLSALLLFTVCALAAPAFIESPPEKPVGESTFPSGLIR